MLDKSLIEGLTEEQAKFEIFRYFFDSATTDLEFSFKNVEYSWLQEPKHKDLLSYAFWGEFIKTINCEIYEIRNESTDIMTVYYPDLLEKMRRLSLELGLNNSLELSNLYSYLLWNGYLSKTKQNVYSTEKRKSISGLFFADIVDGKGVCRNHADMLKDFLNYCDYNAASLINLADKKTKVDYKMPIECKVNTATFKTKLKNFVLSPVIKKLGNHAFTLVKDNNKFYIYDATNLATLAIEDPLSAAVINGKGSFRLNPYASFGFTNNKAVEFDTISELFRTNDLSSPYTRKDFIVTAEENIELFNKSTSLLDDFYTEAKSDIDGIVTATDRLMKVKRK